MMSFQGFLIGPVIRRLVWLRHGTLPGGTRDFRSATQRGAGGAPCFIVRDANGRCSPSSIGEDEPGRRAAAKLLTRDVAAFRRYPIGRLFQM